MKILEMAVHRAVLNPYSRHGPVLLGGWRPETDPAKVWCPLWYFIFFLGATHSNSQGIFLALCLGVAPGYTWQDHAILGTKPSLPTCKTDTLTPVLSISPIFGGESFRPALNLYSKKKTTTPKPLSFLYPLLEDSTEALLSWGWDSGDLGNSGVYVSSWENLHLSRFSKKIHRK